MHGSLDLHLLLKVRLLFCKRMILFDCLKFTEDYTDVTLAISFLQSEQATLGEWRLKQFVRLLIYQLALRLAYHPSSRSTCWARQIIELTLIHHI